MWASRSRPAGDTHERVISEFAISPDGQQIFGSEFGSGIYGGALSIPGAARCALLLSDLLASVPWHAYRERAGRPAEKLSPPPPLLDQPSPGETRVTTISSLALDLILNGNAVGVWATRSRDGWPTSLVPVPAAQVGVRRAREGEIWEPGELLYDVGGRTFRADEVFHVKGPCPPGSLRGYGVLELHLNGLLKLAVEQGKQAQSVGRHGVPTGVVTVEDTPEEPLEQDEADEVKAAWMRAQRERSVAVVNARTKFQPLSWSPEQTQLLEARQFSLHELALIFGLDPSWLGVSGDSMTYSNISQQATNLVRYSLGGHLARFEQAFTASMPRGTWAKANLDALLRGTTQERYEAHAIALTNKFLTVDEVRALEDLPPLTPAQRAELTSAPPSVAPTPDPGEESL